MGRVFNAARSSLLLLTLILVLKAVTPDCPRIFSRAEWGARAARGSVNMTLPVPYVVIHHTVMGEGECSNHVQCLKVMREIQDFHMDGNGWDDIGYSFLIGGDGGIYEGRGWNHVGAHAPGYNDKSIGISLIGDFMTHLPSNLQLNRTEALIQCALELNYAVQNYSLYGHRDTKATDCPGDQLYAEISTWPQFHYGETH